MKGLKIKRLTAICGFLGVFFIFSGSLIAAFNYKGRLEQPYLLANHFVSELGEIGVSKCAWVFNISLIVGGIWITLFMLGLSSVFKNWFSIILGICGLVTGISATLVGFFPMNNLQPHIKVAMLFFNMGLFTMALFSLYVVFSKKQEFPRWFVIPGTLATLCFILFLNFPTPSSSDLDPVLDIQLRLLDNRPSIWMLAVMEWTVVIVVLAWVFIASAYLYFSSDVEMHHQ